MNVLTGSIISVGYAVAGSLPAGFLACDGSAVSRSVYSELFKVIGVSWGAGDGSTTFNLPDLRGRFLRGVDNGAGRDPGATQRKASAPGGATGDACGSMQAYATALPRTGNAQTSVDGSHCHPVPNLPVDSSYYNIAGSHYAEWNSGGVSSSTDGLHDHSINTGGDSETRPANLYVDYLIYANA